MNTENIIIGFNTGLIGLTCVAISIGIFYIMYKKQKGRK